MVRTTVEVSTNKVAEWVCKFFDKELGKPEPWNNFIAEELTINFKGEIHTGDDLISIYPENSMFLLAKGTLDYIQIFKNHQGKLWECTNKCEMADDKRSNITKNKKCNHNILFENDEPITKTWGNHSEKIGKPLYIPMLSCGPASPLEVPAPPTRGPLVRIVLL